MKSNWKVGLIVKNAAQNLPTLGKSAEGRYKNIGKYCDIEELGPILRYCMRKDLRLVVGKWIIRRCNQYKYQA